MDRGHEHGDVTTQGDAMYHLDSIDLEPIWTSNHLPCGIRTNDVETLLAAQSTGHTIRN